MEFYNENIEQTGNDLIDHRNGSIQVTANLEECGLQVQRPKQSSRRF